MSRKEQLMDFYKGRKVLVTGHTGFKGSWLTKILLSLGSEVMGYSLEPDTQPNLFNVLKLEGRIRHYTGDILDYDNLKGVFLQEKPEIVFHLAAQALVRDSYDYPLKTYRTNTLGTAHVLQAVKESKCVKAAVMITTDKVYEDKGLVLAYRENDELGGHDPYSASKVCAEFIILSYIRSFFNTDFYGKKHKTLISSARAGNVIGGGDWAKDRIIPDIVRAFLEKEEQLTIRSPEAVRPWQHVLEPLFGYIILAQGLHEGKKEYVGPWNFAPNDSNCIEVEALVRKAIEMLNKGSYSVKKDKDKHEAPVLKLDSAKAKKELGWNPVLDINTTLSWTFEWYKRFYEKKDVEELTQRQIQEFLSKI